MSRQRSRRGLALTYLAIALVAGPQTLQAQPAGALLWIWSDEGEPARQAPDGIRHFRKVFVGKPHDAAGPMVVEGELDIAADDAFRVWINGIEVGRGADPKRVFRFAVAKHIVMGRNVLAVEARNTGGPAGLLVRLGYVPSNSPRLLVRGDASWKWSQDAPEGWLRPDFDDSSWKSARELGAYGQAGPWRRLTWDAGGDDRFSVPPGFRVDEAARNPDSKGPFSLINLAFDDRGRLLVSQEGGPTLLCTKPDAVGVLQSVRPYCEQVRGSQGMCWIGDALYLVGDGPQGAGLYRVRDTDGDDRTDRVEILHKFPTVDVPGYGRNGGINEHGPHAVLHGPDGQVYLVVGNHAWARPERLADNSPLIRWPHGQMGPDQGKPGTTEDVLLPRINESHAANILAPGGTIWRLDRDGKRMALFAAGFRNQYDAVFNPDGEIFTFDSDMDGDFGLPWYRPVRVCHVVPGADFVWRTGSANTPSYYLDSLPPALETGAGSPTGVACYDHDAFPAKYRGALFLADWTLGLIYAVFPQRDGASYRARAERFCAGVPMNVTDVAVGPDGALYFTLGGRFSRGGVYRIVSEGNRPESPVRPAGSAIEALLSQSQPLAPWSRREARETLRKTPAMAAELARIAAGNAGRSTQERMRAVDLLIEHGPAPEPSLLRTIAKDRDPLLRSHSILALGITGGRDSAETLIAGLSDNDKFVRRRACEALIRAGIEPPINRLWPALGDSDRFVRTAARLVLARPDPAAWIDRLRCESDDQTALEAIVALAQTDRAEAHARAIFDRLARVKPADDTVLLLGLLRAYQLALIHTKTRPASAFALASRCEAMFPHPDRRVSRELAIVMTGLKRSGDLTGAVHARLLGALAQSEGDRPQQIFYFYCLRLLRDGWTPQQKDTLLTWFDGMKSWEGGAYYRFFQHEILRQLAPIFTAEDLGRLIGRGERLTWAAAVLLRATSPGQWPPPRTLGALDERLAILGDVPRGGELKSAIVSVLARQPGPEAPPVLRAIADRDPSRRGDVARALASGAAVEDWPYLVRGLDSSNPLVLVDAIEALLKLPVRPRTDDAAPFRAVLLSSRKVDARGRKRAVALLRFWAAKRFGTDDGDIQDELASWSTWYAQSFPKAPSLPETIGRKGASKYTVEGLRAFLATDPKGRGGDSLRGRAVFAKAQCLKCHRVGKEGEGVGPDLTAVAKKFDRDYVLDSILSPSRVISDQYRSSTVATTRGLVLNGLAVPQGDRLVLLLSDGTKATLEKGEIESQVASLVSVMPEGLLDDLSQAEIADLMQFLESGGAAQTENKR